ncbi:hypothetical protein AXL65_02265 [Salmonella enterica subsp. enterica]|nr:hypothetical protein [Salmonella enterica subsp. enterica]
MDILVNLNDAERRYIERLPTNGTIAVDAVNQIVGMMIGLPINKWSYPTEYMRIFFSDSCNLDRGLALKLSKCFNSGTAPQAAFAITAGEKDAMRVQLNKVWPGNVGWRGFGDLIVLLIDALVAKYQPLAYNPYLILSGLGIDQEGNTWRQWGGLSNFRANARYTFNLVLPEYTTISSLFATHNARENTIKEILCDAGTGSFTIVPVEHPSPSTSTTADFVTFTIGGTFNHPLKQTYSTQTYLQMAFNF